LVHARGLCLFYGSSSVYRKDFVFTTIYDADEDVIDCPDNGVKKRKICAVSNIGNEEDISSPY